MSHILECSYFVLDFKQMTAHHAVTLYLLVQSYHCQMTNIGSLILLLMDVSDPFLELAKLFNYLEKNKFSTIFFSLFCIVFIFSRVIVYPVAVLYPAIFIAYPYALVSGYHIGVYYIIIMSLVILFVLNCYWASLIMRIVMEKVIGNEIRDIRSDDEEENC